MLAHSQLAYYNHDRPYKANRDDYLFSSGLGLQQVSSPSGFAVADRVLLCCLLELDCIKGVCGCVQCMFEVC